MIELSSFFACESSYLLSRRRVWRYQRGSQNM